MEVVFLTLSQVTEGKSETLWAHPLPQGERSLIPGGGQVHKALRPGHFNTEDSKVLGGEDLGP